MTFLVGLGSEIHVLQLFPKVLEEPLFQNTLLALLAHAWPKNHCQGLGLPFNSDVSVRKGSSHVYHGRSKGISSTLDWDYRIHCPIKYFYQHSNCSGNFMAF